MGRKAEVMAEEEKTVLEEADMDTVVTEEYSAKDIQVLEGLEGRPQAPGYVYRLHRPPWSAPPGV